MSEIVRVFVERHQLSRVNSTKGNILLILAGAANDAGHARMTQRDVEHRLTVSLITVKRCFIAMQTPAGGGPFIEKRKGRGWIVLGADQHDPLTCGDDECRAEAHLPAPAENAAARKRRKTAERVRRLRERRRKAAESL